jgi:hypothetical protein
MRLKNDPQCGKVRRLVTRFVARFPTAPAVPKAKGDRARKLKVCFHIEKAQPLDNEGTYRPICEGLA